MSNYTTGEMAKLCNVSVRTVQFYDTKGILPPTELSEGGRRLYTDTDLSKLRLICMLKALGLKLDSIKGILGSEKPGEILNLLLDEQSKQLSDEIEESKKQLEAIRIIKAHIRNKETIPVNSINDIESIMRNEHGLKKVQRITLAWGLAFILFQIGTLILWIVNRRWLPLVIVYFLAVLSAIFIVRMHYKKAAYICPTCNATFKPTWKNFNFSQHMPKTRKLTCPKCGTKGWCVEVLAENRRNS